MSTTDAGREPVSNVDQAIDEAADTVFLGGRILQYRVPDGRVDQMIDVEAHFESALAVRDGRISAIGSDETVSDYIGADTRVVELNGGLVLPGLIDSHVHGLLPTVCDLGYMPATDLDAVLAAIKECLLREDQVPYLNDPTSLLRVTGFSSTSDPDQGTMNRSVLDRLSLDPSEDPMGTGTTRPIVVMFSGYHSEWLNTQALENAGIDQRTPNPPGGDIDKDADGVPTGKVTDVEGFNFGVEPPLSDSVIYAARVGSIKAMARVGITGAFFAGGDPEDLTVWAQIADAGELTMHINQALWTTHIRGLTYDDAMNVIHGMNELRQKYDGYRNAGAPGDLTVDSAKIMCDGVTEFPGQTAAMYEPYRVNAGTTDEPDFVPGHHRGADPSCSDSEAAFRALHDARWSIMTHALGDRAVGDSLDNFAAIQATHSWDSRHVVTHGQFLRASDVPRFAKLKVVYNPQPQWAANNPFMDTLIRPYVSQENFDSQFPLRTVMAHGGVVAGGSDWPVDALNPWLAIQTAISRESPLESDRDAFEGPLGGPREQLTRLQSIYMHTMASAYQLHRDGRTGSLDVGKDADLVVLSQDILNEDVSVHDIYRTESVMTMYQGNVVWEGTAVD